MGNENHKAAAPMNVLWIMTDQHQADCLGFMGHPLVKTPNLDKLAQRGAWFRNMFTCSALCCPSRTSFMTGTYLRTHGHYSNSGNLRNDLPSLPGLARQAGYQTAVCGKVHLPKSVFSQFDYAQTEADYRAYLKKKGLSFLPEAPDFNQKFMSATSPLAYADHEIAWTADRASDYLKMPDRKTNPFLLWCSFSPPHSPHTPPAEMEKLIPSEKVPLDWEGYERFERSRLGQRAMIEDFWKLGAVRQTPEVFQKAVARYLALIAMIDKEVGRLLETLKEQGLEESTIVIFTADHGDFAGHWGQLGKNVAGYDDLLRIPFLYADPGRRDSGRCVENLCQSVDLFPTLCERLGWSVPPGVQGESFTPSLNGKPGSGREYVFAETHNVKTIRSHQWKLIFYVTHPDQGQLFRMGAAPDETLNLWEDPAYSAIRMKMMQELTAWMVRCEQADSMDANSEAFVDTRWYRWLTAQPNQCANPS